MYEKQFWFNVYATCRTQGEDHTSACANANDAVKQTKDLVEELPIGAERR